MVLPQTVKSPTAQDYDIPVIGEGLAKSGRIIDMWANTCAPDPEIWVLGFFQAVPTLFAALTKPEIADINIKKGSHRPRKGRRFKFRAHMVFRDALLEIPVPRWTVFKVYEMSQYGLWFFIVADALQDFSINWMSLAYTYQGCQTPFNAVVMIQQANDLQSLDAGTWPIIPNYFFSNNVAISIPFWRPNLAGEYRLTFEARWRAYPPEPTVPPPYATVVQIDTGSGWEDLVEGNNQEQPNGEWVTTANVTPILFGHEKFRFASKSTVPGHAYLTLQATMALIDPLGIGPDP